MHPTLNIAIRAARSAGQIILRYIPRLDALAVASKDRNDFVSEVDHLAEQEIIKVLHKAFPTHGFLAEESGRVEGETGYDWIIDPLDGTTNYLHGFPQFAVSIALQNDGVLEQAVVYDPLRNEIFSASKGAGAQLDGKRIRVTKQHKLEGALLGTGFPFRQQDMLETYLNMFRSLHKDTAGIRRAGSAALDLAYVAAGRLDGFWEIGLNQWDMAAGALIIKEAGGFVTDFAGGPDYLQTGNIVAGNPKVCQAILKEIDPHLTSQLKA